MFSISKDINNWKVSGSNLTMPTKNPKYGQDPATNHLQSITTVQSLQINYNRIWINRIWPGWFGLQPDNIRISIRSTDFRKFWLLMWNKVDLLINQCCPWTTENELSLNWTELNSELNWTELELQFSSEFSSVQFSQSSFSLVQGQHWVQLYLVSH